MPKPNPTPSTSNPRPIPPQGGKEPQNTADPRGPTADQIARRAYEIFIARGAGHGYDREDWLQAERELTLGRY